MTNDRILPVRRPGDATPTPITDAPGPYVTRAPARDDLSRPTMTRPDWRDRLLDDVLDADPMRALARSLVERIGAVGGEELSPAMTQFVADTLTVATAYLARTELK